MGCEFTLTKLTLREHGEFFQLWYGLSLTTFHRIHMLHIWLSGTTNSNKRGWGIALYIFFQITLSTKCCHLQSTIDAENPKF